MRAGVSQDTVLNVSLSAITLLWNVTDQLARSRGTLSRHAATHPLPWAEAPAVAAQPAPPPQEQPVASASASSIGGAGAQATPPRAVPAPAAAVGADGSDFKPMSPAFEAALNFARGVPSRPASQTVPAAPMAPATTPAAAASAPARAMMLVAAAMGGAPQLHDLNQEESIAMLMLGFRALRDLSVDLRPEVGGWGDGWRGDWGDGWGPTRTSSGKRWAVGTVMEVEVVCGEACEQGAQAGSRPPLLPRPQARNAAVRTLFLALGSHGSRLPPATWAQLLTELLMPLLSQVQRSHAALPTSACTLPCR